jgi:hypothetical protein
MIPATPAAPGSLREYEARNPKFQHVRKYFHQIFRCAPDRDLQVKVAAFRRVLQDVRAFVSESPSMVRGRALLTGFARCNDVMVFISDSAEQFLGVSKRSLYRYLAELNSVQRDDDQIGHDEISHYFGCQLLFETARLDGIF